MYSSDYHLSKEAEKYKSTYKTELSVKRTINMTYKGLLNINK